MKKFLVLICLIFLFLPAELYAQKFRIWPFYGLTGGGGKALDGILSESGIYCNNGDYATGIDAYGYCYFYYYDSSNNNTTNPESSPNVIVPDDDTNTTGAWLITSRTYADGFFSTAADGAHYNDFSNSGAPDSNTDGMAIARRDYDIIAYLDGTIVIPAETCRQVTLSSTQTIDKKYCFGTTIYMSAAGTLTLPAVEVGMRLRIYGTGANVVIIDPDGTEVLYLYGSVLAAGNCIDSPGNAGDFVDLEYRASGQWTVFEGEGTFVDGGAS